MPIYSSNNQASGLPDATQSGQNKEPSSLKAQPMSLCNLGLGKGGLTKNPPMGQCTQQVRGLANTLLSSGSRMMQLAQLMLPNKGFDYAAQIQKSNEIQARAERMGYKGPQRLFDLIDAERPVLHRIVQPKTNAKLVLADYYRCKYKVHTYIDTGEPDPEECLDWIRRILNKHPNQAVGVVLFEDKPWRKAAPAEHVDLYAGHCTPMVFKYDENGLSCVNLDPVRKAALMPFELREYFTTRLGLPLRMLTASSVRQLDWYSCHTNAMVLLKDCLRHIKGKSDALSFFLEHDPEAAEDLLRFGRTTAHLPSPLHKATQIDKAITFDRCHGLDSIRPYYQKDKSTGANTLATQRARYDRTHQAQGSVDIFQPKTVKFNHYLNVKAYHHAETVLKRLEELGTAEAREAYLKKLKERNEAREE